LQTSQGTPSTTIKYYKIFYSILKQERNGEKTGEGMRGKGCGNSVTQLSLHEAKIKVGNSCRNYGYHEVAPANTEIWSFARNINQLPQTR
jgi:hypothetical protein